MTFRWVVALIPRNTLFSSPFSAPAELRNLFFMERTFVATLATEAPKLKNYGRQDTQKKFVLL